MVSTAAAALMAGCLHVLPVQAADIDWSKVAAAFGRPLPTAAAGVYRFGLPRSDLKVVVDGVSIRPALALGGWVAFMPAGDGAMVMGDLVLAQNEINPVMKRLIEGGFEISAIHNHLLRAEPSPMYMHVSGHGDPVRLAEALRAGLALSALPAATPPASPPPPLDIDTTAIDRIMQVKGTANGGVYQFTVPRTERIREDGMDVPVAMGSGHVVNFQPTGGGKAAITGDFVLLADEVNPVLRTLRAKGIEVTAVHSHMLRDDPRLFFMHFWANDDAVTLAGSIRAALDMTKAKGG
ncbi:MAG TPA: DUF1259 domain-containing protein [Vineibacter sp.]|nr:DUF1259 domain-containing protein [Vineibacter sp.]